MKNKCIRLAAILSLLFCLTLAACTDKNPPPADTTDGTPTEGDSTVTEAPTEGGSEETTEAPTEAETDPVPEPINRSEYPKEQAGAKTETVL